jgi:DNA-binding transcriptional ArsR family regulator
MQMRRDEIEHRIIALEEDVRTLKSDHRDGVEIILAEMRKMQNTVIEERIASVARQLADGYEKMVIGLLMRSAERNLDDQCKDPCVRNRRKECLDFLLSRIRDSAQILDPVGTVRREGRDLTDEELVHVVPHLAVPPCSDCFTSYLKEKEQLNQAMKNLSSCSDGLIRKSPAMFLSEIPSDKALSTIIEPLAHENRFAMLKALSTGSMTFTMLGDLTGSKGGHLLYHLGKLIEAGLVMKNDDGKRYSITDRGLGVMNLITQLYTG